jgi:uncharacterized membrane protein
MNPTLTESTMIDGITTVAGLKIPSTDPIFLLIVALHVPLGLISVIAGAAAMLSPKGRGRHPWFGTIYFWSVAATFMSATALSLMRRNEDCHLFVLGTLTFIAAYIGRAVRRRRRPGWARLHIAGMGTSYVLLLTAFYEDNGKQLPLWRDLPVWTYWTLPALVGAPLILWALLRQSSLFCSS